MTIKHRVGYLIGSVFIVWHTLAIVFVAPWPFNNRVQDFLAPFFLPYTNSLRLDETWQFYGPDPGLGTVLRYGVTSAETQKYHRVNLTEDLDRSDPAFYRYTTVFIYTVDYPAFRTSLLEYLCRKHADLAPATVHLETFRQRPLTREAYLRGDRPLDAAYLRRSDVARVSCRPAHQEP